MDIYLPNEGEGPFPCYRYGTRRRLERRRQKLLGGAWGIKAVLFDLRWRQSGTGWPRNIRICPDSGRQSGNSFVKPPCGGVPVGSNKGRGLGRFGGRSSCRACRHFTQRAGADRPFAG